MDVQRLYAGDRYIHYKGNLYQIVAVAMHTETEEDIVVYQALYGEFKIFARPLKMFFEAVKDDAGNIVPRFVKVGRCTAGNNKAGGEAVQAEMKAQTEEVNVVDEEPAEEAIIEGVNPQLIEFLDAESSVERLEILHKMRKSIDHKTISDIAAALDIVIEEKDMEERIKDLETCLQTRARFETTRLR